MTEGCKHENQAYCQRTFADETLHIGKMCLNCGIFRSVKKDSIPLLERNNLREYNPAIRKNYYDKLRDKYQMESQLAREEVTAENRRIMDEYYNSSEWQSKRRERFIINDRINNGRCEVCSSKDATEIHHITYARFRNEWLFDLSAICHDCHKSYHAHMQD